MKNLLNKGKDKALSVAILSILNKKIKLFGHVSDLKLNTNKKTIKLNVELKGELEPLLVVVNRYEIKEIEEKYYLIVYDIETSREWINLLSKEYFSSKKFEIPEKFVKTIKIII